MLRLLNPLVSDDGPEQKSIFVRSHRLTARTLGFHPRNRSSILRGITSTKRRVNTKVFAPFLFVIPRVKKLKLLYGGIEEVA